jgi:hypothetical protein
LLLVLPLATQLKRSLQILCYVGQRLLIELLLLLRRIHDEFKDEVLAFFCNLQIRGVEIDVPEFVSANEGRLNDLVVIFFKTDQFAILVQSQEKHLQAVIDPRGKPVCAETHEKLEEDEVDALLAYCSFKSDNFLQKDEELLPFAFI